MEGSWTPQIGVKNLYQYNGTELNEDLELDVNMTFFRTYDAAIGRWWQIDPLGEMAMNYNGYNFSFINPIKFADPWGDLPSDKTKRKIRKAKRQAKRGKCPSSRGGKKKNKPKRQKNTKQDKNRRTNQNSSGRTDTKYDNKWSPIFEWDTNFDSGTAGSRIFSTAGLNDPIMRPTLTHNIPNPNITSDFPIRTRVSTRPRLYFSSLGSFLNRWEANVNRGGDNINIYPSGANPGESVVVAPVLTSRDISFLNGGGNVGSLNLHDRNQQLQLRMVVEEFRTFRITFRGVWPFRTRTLTPLSPRHPANR